MKKILLSSLVLLAIFFTACDKQPEDFYSPPIQDFSPLVVGKYITYQLDTFKYLPFSLKDTTVSYQVKHVVDGLITDNLGRPAYRIIRYIRKIGQNAWSPDNTFMALNTGTTYEFVENNLRFLKLQMPITDGFTWKGNAYIDTYSLNSTVTYLDNWDYTYDSLYHPMTLGNIQLDSTVTVRERDEVIGIPENPESYSQTNYSSEIYAKGIGLVYRKFLHTEFQPATPGSVGYFVDGSYGVTMTMIDHN